MKPTRQGPSTGDSHLGILRSMAGHARRELDAHDGSGGRGSRQAPGPRRDRLQHAVQRTQAALAMALARRRRTGR